MARPLIGITIDNVDSTIASGKYESNVAYSEMVARAGGLPVLLPQQPELAAYFVDICNGIMLTGGNDALSEEFGVPAHPRSECIAPRRQAFELALLNALAQTPQRPVLGVCLGMQLMALHAGGRMNQHLPDTLPTAVDDHQNNHRHPIIIGIRNSVLLNTGSTALNLISADLAHEMVVSSHHQAVVDAGRLRVIAAAHDGVIEAHDDPGRPFYLGVQWHPERGEGVFNFDLITRFVEFCAQSRV